MDVLNYALGFDNPFDKFNAGVERGLGVKANNEAQLQAIANNKRAQELHQSNLATAALNRQQTQQQIESNRLTQDVEQQKANAELRRLRLEQKALMNIASGKEWNEGLFDAPTGTSPDAGGVSSAAPATSTAPSTTAPASIQELLNNVDYQSLSKGQRDTLGLMVLKGDLEGAVTEQEKAEAQQVATTIFPLLHAVLSENYPAVNDMKRSQDSTLAALASMFSDGATSDQRAVDAQKAAGMVNELDTKGGLSKDASATLLDLIKGSAPLDTKQRSELASKLEKSFSGIVNNYNTTLTAYKSLVLSAQSNNVGVGDIAAIFTFMKTLDPTSVVRESEFATLANSQGTVAAIENLFPRLSTGQRLPEGARESIQDLSYNFTLNAYINAENSLTPLRAQAKEFGIPDRLFETKLEPPPRPSRVEYTPSGVEQANKPNSGSTQAPAQPEFVMLPIPDESGVPVTTRVPLLTSNDDPRKKALKRGDYYAILELTADNSNGPLMPNIYVKE